MSLTISESVNQEGFLDFAEHIFSWQNSSLAFSRYLKEKDSMSMEEYRSQFQDKYSTGKTRIFSMSVNGEIASVLMLTNQMEQDKHFKVSIRTNPIYTGKGLTSYFQSEIFQNLFRSQDAQVFISQHAGPNKDTFFLNKKCGGVLMRYKDDETFFPNVNQTLGVFRWEFSSIINPEYRKIEDCIGLPTDTQIMLGLQKYKYL